MKTGKSLKITGLTESSIKYSEWNIPLKYSPLIIYYFSNKIDLDVNSLPLLSNLLQITFGPYDPLLSDHSQYSSLYQMAPQDTSLTLAIVSLIVHFRWLWVGLILPDDHKGNKILSDFREEMERKRICMAFVKMIPATWTSYFAKFWKNMDETNVIIIYGDIDSLEGLMRNIGQRLLTWIVWVMNTEHHVLEISDYFMLDSFHGSLIFKHHYRENSDFTKFIQTVNPKNYPEDIYLPKLWYYFFKCSFSDINCHVLDNCQTNASLDVLPSHIFDVAMTEESTSIYNGVYALAHSLHEMRLQQLQVQPFENGEGMVFFPWQVQTFLLYFIDSTLAYEICYNTNRYFKIQFILATIANSFLFLILSICQDSFKHMML
jgi:vomeronasal 2 receptor